MPRKINLTPTGCVCRNPLCQIPYGLCHCGCKEKTPVAKRNVRRLGLAKGFPLRYIVGHHIGERRNYSDANTIILINGIQCRRIPLTKGAWTFVDEKNFRWLIQWRWYLKKSRSGKLYAARNAPASLRVLGIRTIYMHREILGLTSKGTFESDHVDPPSTLDNREANLRAATHSENLRNASLSKNNKSGRKGISWRKDTQKWHAAIGHNGKSISLGDSDDFVEACCLREEAEKKYHGEFARAK